MSKLGRRLTAAAVEVFLKFCINSTFTNFKNLFNSGHFLLCYDWPLVPKPTVIAALNRKVINHLENNKFSNILSNELVHVGK